MCLFTFKNIQNYKNRSKLVMSVEEMCGESIYGSIFAVFIHIYAQIC